jgi:mannan endo-1,4-beta-mannosidase
VAHGLHIKAGRLVEANGSDLVLRGINHGFAWHMVHDNTFRDIKATGANSVRVALPTGYRWPAVSLADVKWIVAQCKLNKLVCVLDAHDSSGHGQDPLAQPMIDTVKFWTALKPALLGTEDYVIINIADEPFGSYNDNDWFKETSAAVLAMRHAGFTHVLWVDSPSWAQDDHMVMRDNAAKVLAVDPRHDLMFDVHMYGVFDTAPKVYSYMASFAVRKLPLVVGEYSDIHTYGNPDEDAIMGAAAKYGFGYFGWSWSGNDYGTAYLDMVYGYNPTQLSPWGKRFLWGPNGIHQLSPKPATYFTKEVPRALVRCN